MEYAQLLLDIEELNHLFRESVSLSTLLDRTTHLVGAHFKADVCSIYIFDDETEVLTLAATRGLNPHGVGVVKLRVGEGLVGTALQELRCICENDGSRDPRYKFFPGINEERFEAFLAAPITRGIARIGVLVLQREKSTPFAEADTAAVKIVASQLANIIENAKFLMAVHAPHEEKKPPSEVHEMRIVKGQGASSGFVWGNAVVVNKEQALALLFKKDFDKSYTLTDFDKAIKATEQQLEELQGKVEEKLSDVASLIFAAHLVILKDKAFIGEMRKLIEMGGNPPEAVLKIARKYMELFAASSQPYVREKVHDIADLVLRLVRNLVSGRHEAWAYRDRIVVVQNLFPSDLLAMASEGVKGVVMVGGGVTSHVAILSQSLGIPFVIVTASELMGLPEGSTILVDASQGNVYINPHQDAIARFEASRRTDELLAEEAVAMQPQTTTRDGCRVKLMANINLLNDARQASTLGAEGIGLYRTEFPFLIRTAFPTEEEQYAVYRKLIAIMPDKPVSLRTLDIGGDKILSYYPDAKEGNPMLGLRSIRFCLENVEVFKQQLRAMLRAAAGADVGIMFPMISSLDEFTAAKAVVLECVDQLAAEKVEHNSSPRIGMMVEIPSVLGIIDELAAEADFFSLGTNDFIQYMLAVDRTNERVSKFYLPSHPSVLRAIKKVVDAGTAAGIEVAICGDMAHEQRYVPFLLGAGFRTFSVGPAYLTRVQKAILSTDLPEAQLLAAEMLAQPRTADVEAVLSRHLARMA
jgi:phosphotransferase system, enzyme I, PtsP